MKSDNFILESLELNHLKWNVFYTVVPRKALSADNTNLYDFLPPGKKEMTIYTPKFAEMINGYSGIIELTKEVDFRTNAVLIVEMTDWGITIYHPTGSQVFHDPKEIKVIIQTSKILSN